LHAGKGLYEEAESEYNDSIESIDRAIGLNESDADYHSDRGTSLHRLAVLHAGKGLYEDAESEYRDAIASYDRAIEMTDWKIPSHIFFKAMTHEKYAQLLFQMDRYEEVKAQIDQFIHAMYRQGNLEEENGNREVAMKSYRCVIATIFDERRDREAMNLRCLLRRLLILILCHKRLGKIMTELGKEKQDIGKEYEAALNLVEMALKMELDESTKEELENEKRELKGLLNDLDS
ncbi:MAG: hypothetical protein JW697_03425, partial [Kosmotogaceae bacterium]|nr:hypothetical protein [Kosmotogaceae bacterium]